MAGRLRFRQDQTFGGWTLGTRCGKGGNGEVWRAAHSDGREGAIKLLQRSDRDRLTRFQDEIRFLLSADAGPGVLPLIDHDLNGDPPWYVMPLARPIREVLGGDPPVDAVVGALAAIATTLARLVEKGVGHRDLKPANLFELRGEWLVGDFGLAQYPEKNPVTAAGHRLGSRDYLAPEMRADADTAAAEPADVYSLGKTAWVLLTGRDLPLPGPHRLDDPTTSLRSYIEHPRTGELDLLLERCTRNNPSGRISMEEMAHELSQILKPLPEVGEEKPNVEDLFRRIESLTAASQASAEQRMEWVRAANAALDEFNTTWLSRVHNEYLARIPGLGSTYGSGFGFQTLCSPHLPPPGLIHSGGWASVVVTNDLPRVELLLAAIGMELTDREVIRLTAGFALLDQVAGSPHPDVVWVDTREERLGSAAQAAAIAQLGQGLLDNVSAALMRLAERLGSQPS